jgi:hypothetical protein
MTAGASPQRVATTPGGLEPPPRPSTLAAAHFSRQSTNPKDANLHLFADGAQRAVPYPSEKLMRSIAAKLPPPHAPGGVTSGVVVQRMAGWTPLTVKDVLKHMVRGKRAVAFTAPDGKGHRKIFYKRAPATAATSNRRSER